MNQLSEDAKRIAPEEFEVRVDHWTDPFGEFESDEKVLYMRADIAKKSDMQVAREFWAYVIGIK